MIQQRGTTLLRHPIPRSGKGLTHSYVLVMGPSCSITLPHVRGRASLGASPRPQQADASGTHIELPAGVETRNSFLGLRRPSPDCVLYPATRKLSRPAPCQHGTVAQVTTEDYTEIRQIIQPLANSSKPAYNSNSPSVEGRYHKIDHQTQVETMLERLARVEQRYDELNKLLADPALATDYVKMTKYGQERAELEEIVGSYRRYKHLQQELETTGAMLEEELTQEMVQLVQEEMASLQQESDALKKKLEILLVPKDPKDEKNVIVEIRAGTGGEEAALFAADLYRMYTRYAEKHTRSTEILSANRTGIGGFKEVIFLVKGRGAYSKFKYESGVHRVQRVPVTEAGGRLHTSAATVAVLPEMDEVEVKIDPDDLRIDVFRATGHGGQSVNTTDSAVRITHLPTGLVASCQDERSQLQNKLRAMSILRARLYDMEETRRWAEMDAERRSQVGTGERSEKIRTYNFPQDRVTDHRIGLTSYRLQEILDGDLDEFVYELTSAEQSAKLQGVA